MKIDKTIKFTLFSELIFTLLPIVILTIYWSFENSADKIFYNTEWSIISIILFGQTVVKFSSGIANSQEKVRWQLVALVISLIIVLGIVPSSVLLILNISAQPMTFWKALFQIIIFGLSVTTYFIVGSIGQKLLDE